MLMALHSKATLTARASTAVAPMAASSPAAQCSLTKEELQKYPDSLLTSISSACSSEGPEDDSSSSMVKIDLSEVPGWPLKLVLNCEKPAPLRSGDAPIQLHDYGGMTGKLMQGAKVTVGAARLSGEGVLAAVAAGGPISRFKRQCWKQPAAWACLQARSQSLFVLGTPMLLICGVTWHPSPATSDRAAQQQHGQDPSCPAAAPARISSAATRRAAPRRHAPAGYTCSCVPSLYTRWNTVPFR
ncbi:hypothetical protein COO60DRAFT_1459936 [Scenedesmus sp. NREL 46B-D3]|nr:hypothetical protein COO60DRAFT_1459936 [Scenedesmus sp. NREL 46B-D3]